MSNPINNGGPAFPEPFVPQSSGVALNMHPGMSLRDWFAGQALNHPCSQCDDAAERPAKAAAWAYELADAMLAAREAK